VNITDLQTYIYLVNFKVKMLEVCGLAETMAYVDVQSSVFWSCNICIDIASTFIIMDVLRGVLEANEMSARCSVQKSETWRVR
jgi:hypothetical protein